MVVQPTIISPKRSYASRKLRQLIDAVEQYIGTLGYFYKSIEVSPSKGERDIFNSDSTTIYLRDFNYMGVSWGVKFAFYEIEGFACRNLEATVGSGPWELVVSKSFGGGDGGPFLKFRVETDANGSFRFYDFTPAMLIEIERAKKPAIDAEAPKLADLAAKPPTPLMRTHCSVCHAKLPAPDAANRIRCEICSKLAYEGGQPA